METMVWTAPVSSSSPGGRMSCNALGYKQLVVALKTPQTNHPSDLEPQVTGKYEEEGGGGVITEP